MDLVAGLPESEVFQKKEITEAITKYNEDTGKPYLKKFTREEFYFGNIKVKHPFIEDVLCEFSNINLDVFSSGSDNRDRIVRKLILNVEPGEIKLIDITDALKKASEEFEKLGITSKVKVYQISWVGH